MHWYKPFFFAKAHLRRGKNRSKLVGFREQKKNILHLKTVTYRECCHSLNTALLQLLRDKQKLEFNLFTERLDHAIHGPTIG
jgi:hypothetical protein